MPHLLAGLENLLVTLGVREPRVPWKTFGAPSHRALSAKTRAAFGAPRVDDSPSAGGAHACAEAVGALTLQDARLKCSFHGEPLMSVSLKRAEQYEVHAVLSTARIEPPGCSHLVDNLGSP